LPTCLLLTLSFFFFPLRFSVVHSRSLLGAVSPAFRTPLPPLCCFCSQSTGVSPPERLTRVFGPGLFLATFLFEFFPLPCCAFSDPCRTNVLWRSLPQVAGNPFRGDNDLPPCPTSPVWSPYDFFFAHQHHGRRVSASSLFLFFPRPFLHPPPPSIKLCSPGSCRRRRADFNCLGVFPPPFLCPLFFSFLGNREGLVYCLKSRHGWPHLLVSIGDLESPQVARSRKNHSITRAPFLPIWPYSGRLCEALRSSISYTTPFSSGVPPPPPQAPGPVASWT